MTPKSVDDVSSTAASVVIAVRWSLDAELQPSEKQKFLVKKKVSCILYSCGNRARFQ